MPSFDAFSTEQLFCVQDSGKDSVHTVGHLTLQTLPPLRSARTVSCLAISSVSRLQVASKLEIRAVTRFLSVCAVSSYTVRLLLTEFRCHLNQTTAVLTKLAAQHSPINSHHGKRTLLHCTISREIAVKECKRASMAPIQIIHNCLYTKIRSFGFQSLTETKSLLNSLRTSKTPCPLDKRHTHC